MSTPPIRLSLEEWTAREEAHRARLSPVLEPFLEGRRRQKKNPTMDFLFEYYSLRPARLYRWTPGVGVLLEGEAAQKLLQRPEFVERDGGVMLDPCRFPEKRLRGTRWVLEVLERSRERAPFLGCFGLHEWAMVYRTEDIRHKVPLRLSPEEVAEVVEARQVRCSHFDAFRFFTPAARPLNKFQPTVEEMPELEQPGCLHTNMDLYKWAYKLQPWVASEAIADGFEIALEARELDMKASPYDMRAYGMEPIKIETPEGRKEYQNAQMALAERAAPVRERLIAAYRNVLAHVEKN